MGKQVAIRANQQGFGIVPLLLIAGAIFLIGLTGYAVFANARNQSGSTENSGAGKITPSPVDTTPTTSSKLVRWSPDGSGNWRAAEAPPTCPVQPMMQSPVSTTNLTLTQYPGQVRGGVYRTVGTMTFTGISPNAITVKAPMDAVVQRGAKYTINGETQYVFDFVNSCGVMYRLGHLRVLTSALEPLADSIGLTDDADPRLTTLTTTVTVRAGERLATGVGLVHSNQPIVDFGVYDLRSLNKGSDAAYVRARGMDPAGFGVCWFDWLTTSDALKVHSTAAAQKDAEKKNDYCLEDRL